LVTLSQTNLRSLFGLPSNGGDIHGLVDDVISTKLLALNAKMRLVNCINDHRTYSSLPPCNMHVLAEQSLTQNSLMAANSAASLSCRINASVRA